MGKVERFGVILGHLSAGETLAVDRLARELEVSDATIRRDLRELAGQALLTRTHGGAVARDVGYELPVRYRSGQQSEAKRRIAAAAALVPDGAVVGISGGTTTTEVARLLAPRRLTVVTNAINIAAELALRPDIDLLVTGGLVRSQSFELVGPVAERTIQAHNLDLLLLGVDGIDAKAGCTTHDPVEARVDGAMVEQARQVVVVADATKLGRVAFAQICRLDQVGVLVTAGPLDGPDRVQALADAGLDVRLA